MVISWRNLICWDWGIFFGCLFPVPFLHSFGMFYLSKYCASWKKKKLCCWSWYSVFFCVLVAGGPNYRSGVFRSIWQITERSSIYFLFLSCSTWGHSPKSFGFAMARSLICTASENEKISYVYELQCSQLDNTCSGERDLLQHRSRKHHVKHTYQSSKCLLLAGLELFCSTLSELKLDVGHHCDLRRNQNIPAV